MTDAMGLAQVERPESTTQLEDYEAQTQWQSVIEDILTALTKAKGAALPPLPQF